MNGRQPANRSYRDQDGREVQKRGGESRIGDQGAGILTDFGRILVMAGGSGERLSDTTGGAPGGSYGCYQQEQHREEWFRLAHCSEHNMRGPPRRGVIR